MRTRLETRERIATLPRAIQSDWNDEEAVRIVSVNDPCIHEAHEHLPEHGDNGQRDDRRGGNGSRLHLVHQFPKQGLDVAALGGLGISLQRCIQIATRLHGIARRSVHDGGVHKNIDT